MDSRNDRHPEEDVLEKYALGALADSEAFGIETHLFSCERCRERLQEVESFIAGLRGLRRGADANPMDETHVTDTGSVRLCVEKTQPEGWMAQMTGQGLERREQFRSAFEANAFLQQCFRHLFPEHRCRPECGPSGSQPPRKPA